MQPNEKQSDYMATIESDPNTSLSKKSIPIHKIVNFMDEVYDQNNNVKSSKQLFLEHLKKFAERNLTK